MLLQKPFIAVSLKIMVYIWYSNMFILLIVTKDYKKNAQEKSSFFKLVNIIR